MWVKHANPVMAWVESRDHMTRLWPNW